MSTADLGTALTTAPDLMRLSSQFAAKGSRCQLIDGKVQMMSPSGGFHGVIAADLASLLNLHVKKGNLGRCFGAETGFLIATNPDTVLAPDVAFVSADRLNEVGLSEGYFPEAPALAVEIVSPGDTAEEVDDKARRWLAAGTRLVWVVYPKRQTVTVYRSPDNARLLSADDTLDGAEVINDFAVKIAELFAGVR